PDLRAGRRDRGGAGVGHPRRAPGRPRRPRRAHGRRQDRGMIPLSLRFAVRELRAGVRGFRIFLACLALGVAAIAAASSTAEAFRRGLAEEARTILGGDLAVSADRAFTPAERAAFERTGRATYAVATRAMAE